MKCRPLLIALLAASAGTAQAQTFEEYLRLRKEHKVARATDIAALETFVGTRTLELDATVEGIVRSNGSIMLILGRDGGGQLLVRCESHPDWLAAGVKARLLMEAQRASDSGPLEARLLGAANAQRMAEHDAKSQPKAQPATTRTQGSSTSRGSGRRPPPLPGDLRPGTPTPHHAGDSSVLAAYIRFVQSANPKLSAEKAASIARSVLGYSEHFGLDARLVMAVVLCESGFEPTTRSRAGAMGLGQLMPGTARELGVTNAYDTDQNLYGTVKLLRQHIDRYDAKTGNSFESLVLTLAAYNAGPGAVSRHGGVPPYRETQNYVRKVIATYRQLVGSQ